MADADPPPPGPLTRSRRRPKLNKKGRPIIINSGEKNFIPATKIYPKAPRPVLIPITEETMWVYPWLYTLGDIVSLVSHDRELFFAQITCMLKDLFGGKFAIIRWLIPSNLSIPGRFDPDTYMFAFQEETPRDMAVMEFVCHAPNEYYYKRDLQLIRREPQYGFAHTSKGFRIVKLPAEEFNTDSE